MTVDRLSTGSHYVQIKEYNYTFFQDVKAGNRSDL